MLPIGLLWHLSFLGFSYRLLKDLVAALTRCLGAGTGDPTLGSIVAAIANINGAVSRLLEGKTLTSVLNRTNGRGIRNRRRGGLSMLTGSLLLSTLTGGARYTKITSRRLSSTAPTGTSNDLLILFSPLSNSSGVSVGVTINAVFSVLPCRHRNRLDRGDSFLRTNGRRLTTNCLLCNASAMLTLAVTGGIIVFDLSPSAGSCVLVRSGIRVGTSADRCTVGTSGCHC